MSTQPMPNKPALTINIMTAALTPGDAIGNFMLMCADILRGWGATVNLYADYVAPELATAASLSEYYRPNNGILWFHYSIWSDNVSLALQTTDFLLVDFHGITPPPLLAGNSHLQQLCQQAIDALPTVAARADAAIAHSSLTEQELLTAAPGLTVYRVPLAVDLGRYTNIDQPLADLLAAVPYWLFVGRIVPQKDIIGLLNLFAAVRASSPDLRLILVGSHHLLPAYKRQIDQQIGRLGLQGSVDFTGQVNNPAVLAALFSNARFYCALSDWESFCVPIAESLYFGTPCIVSDTPPLPEVAGAGGIVVDKHHPAAAADRIIDLHRQPAQYAALRDQAAAVGTAYTSAALDHNLRTMFVQINAQLSRL